MSDREHARLFVALELPEPVRDSLARWGASLAAADRGLRPVRAESLHVTLCFLGPRPLDELDAIGAACAEVVGPPAFALSTAGVLGLPPRRPRVLAVAIEDRSRGLARLQAAVAGELERIGVHRPERRGFVPHVTIARTRRPEAGRGERLEAERSRGRLEPERSRGRTPRLLGPMPFTASTVTVFRSRPAAGGAVYEPLCSAFLDRPS